MQVNKTYIQQEQMCDSNLRMFQIKILVPFLERIESKCACICSWELVMECWRMAARLASESSVTTSDRSTELRLGRKGTCAGTNILSTIQSEETPPLCPFLYLEYSLPVITAFSSVCLFAFKSVTCKVFTRNCQDHGLDALQ